MDETPQFIDLSKYVTDITYKRQDVSGDDVPLGEFRREQSFTISGVFDVPLLSRYWAFRWSSRLPRKTKKAVLKSATHAPLGVRERRRAYRALVHATFGPSY